MEQNYIIATASTCDLTRDYLEENNIPFIPYSYIVGDDVYYDDCLEETRDKVYKRMRGGEILSTSAINAFTYREFFEELLKQNKDIIFMDMSRPLSASYRFCDEAIEELKKDYPDRRIVNVNTCCVSGGLGLLVMMVNEQYKAGKPMDELLTWIEDNKLKIAHRFTVDDLSWLKRGGRVSNAAALVGTLLSIKPVLYVPNDGSLVVSTKARGRKRALATIIDSIKKDLVNYADGARILINHADCYDEAKYIADELKAEYPGIKEIMIKGLGVVIGAHCGPGLIAVFYITDKRSE